MHLWVVGRKWCCRVREVPLLHKVFVWGAVCWVIPQMVHWREGWVVLSRVGFGVSCSGWTESVWAVGCWKLCFCCECLWHLSEVLELRTGRRQCVQLYVTGRKMCLKSGLLAMGHRCEWEVLSCPQ